MLTPSVRFGILMPALVAGHAFPRTPAEAREYVAEQNAAAKRRREDEERAHARRRQELDDAIATSKRLSAEGRPEGRPADPRAAWRAVLVAAYGKLNAPREPLNVVELYCEHNAPAGAGWAAAVGRVNREHLAAPGAAVRR